MLLICLDCSSIRLLRFIVCGIGGALLLIGLIVLTCIEQDDARHNFGHSGGMWLFALIPCAVSYFHKVSIVTTCT